MARQAVKKTEITTETVDEVVKDVEIEVEVKDKSNDIQKELLKMIEDLKNELNAERNKNVGHIIANNTLDLNRMIKVTSLLNNTYNLTTQPRGRGGAVYTFNHYGETKPIRVKDMLDIVAIHGSQFEQCFAILETKRDYDDLGIGYIYDDLLTKEKVSKIIDTCTNEYVDVILSMSEELQSSILSQIAENICNGKNYDFNAIETLRAETQLQEHINSFKEKELD